MAADRGSIMQDGPGTEPELATLRAWYRLRKPLNPENAKKKCKIPLPGLGPENTKKLPKKYKMVIFGPFLYVFGNFFVFSGPNPGRGILYFFRIFFVFSGLRGFCNLYQARRVANRNRKSEPVEPFF